MSYMETATYQLFVLGLLQLAEYFLQLLTPNAIRNSYMTRGYVDTLAAAVRLAA